MLERADSAAHAVDICAHLLQLYGQGMRSRDRVGGTLIVRLYVGFSNGTRSGRRPPYQKLSNGLETI